MLLARQREWLNLLAKNRITFPAMSPSIILQGLLILVVSSLGSAYIQQIKHSGYQTAHSMHQEPRTDRDQIVNADALKVAGAFLGSLLFYPVVARAADVITGISDIAINYDGVSKPIGEYLGKKGTLIINVASQCALTPQYDDLVTLYNKYKADGFTILAFPCNQFGSQEPQGALTGLISVTSIVGPLMMTNLFSYFTSADAPIQFPGAPFLMGAILTLFSVFFAVRTMEKHF